MKPIWYFVGLLLLVIGVIVLLTGVYNLFNPPVQKTVLAELHPDIWWGVVMIIAGGLFLIKNWKIKVE